MFGPSGALQGTWNGADTPLKTFSTENGITGVAVDNSEDLFDWAAGDVYVALGAQREAGTGRCRKNVVDVFKPEAGGGEKYVGQLPGPHGGDFGPGDHSIAVDEANGDVIVAEGEDTEESAVYVFEPTTPGNYALVRTLTGTPKGGFGPEGVGAVAVDGGVGAGAGDIYVSENGGGVYEFGPAGEYLGELAGGALHWRWTRKAMTCMSVDFTEEAKSMSSARTWWCRMSKRARRRW